MAAAKRKKGECRLIILGLDGLSPEIIEPMMDQGRLPAFSRLRETGSYRRLATTNPSQSPVAWAGFATGRNPGKNGVFDFISRNPNTYGLSLALSNIVDDRPRPVIRSMCFWDYTSYVRVPTVVIACPMTFPPTRIHGRMLSGMGVPDIQRTEGTFAFYTSESLDEARNYGGNVSSVRKSSVIFMNLVGPKVDSGDGGGEHLKVLFKAEFKGRKNSVEITLQKNRFVLEKGRWSDWKEVTFKLGLFKRVKGILKFLLMETEPHFKLYASPVNFDPREPYFQISHPPSYSRKLAARIGLYHTQGMPMDTWAVNEKRLMEREFLEHVDGIFREKRAMLDFELSRFRGGVLFCYFDSADIIQHMFWRYVDSSHPLYEVETPENYRLTIEDWYKKMDGMLGSVMEGAGSELTVMVVSDHGCGSFRRAVHVNSWLRKHGYLELKDPGAVSGPDLLAGVDWSKTRAYAIGFGAIYINQKGRERDGIVKPGAETNALKKEISKRLEGWIDEAHGMRVINKVHAGEDIFRGRYVDEMPDLYIGFNIGYRASKQTAVGSVPACLIEDNTKKWSGSHLFDPVLIPGVFFCNRETKKGLPTIYDIAPTVLKLAGYSDERIGSLDLDGEPLF